MKVTKKLTILLPLMIVCLMILGTGQVSAASTEFLSGTGDISIYSSTGYTLMDGVREGEVTLKKSSGSTVKAHVVLVKANAKASFKPVIPNYYTSGSTKAQRVAKSENWSNWGLTGVTNMANQYLSAADTSSTVLAGINGDFGIGTKPRGSLILEGGAEIGASSAYEDEFFFGHKSTTGTLNILQRTSSQKSTFDEAICGGAHILRNGELFGVDGETVSRQRTGIGIKNNGDVLLISVESGITVKQLAELMQASGCWNGINMDGGGSSTLITKRSTDSGTVRRTPLSGYADVDGYGERRICSALLLVADSSAVANNVGTVSGNSITTDKTTYDVGEDIYVTASSASDGSWVSILKADDTADASSYFWYYTYGNDGNSTWCWENGTTNNIYAEGMCSGRDNVTASTKLVPGRYRAAILNYNSSGTGYQELASRYFTIESGDTTPYALTTDKNVYTVGESIMISGTKPSGDTGAWFGIVKSGRSILNAYGGASYYWGYLPGDGSAFDLFDSGYSVGDEDYAEFSAAEQALIDRTNNCLLPGVYDIILLTYDGYTVATDANGNPVVKTISIIDEDQQYSVTYKDGSTTLSGLSPSSYMLSAAQSGAISLPTSVSKTGYTFLGWYDNASFSGSAVTSIPQGSTGNKTYYAKFEKKTYEVIFDTGSGQISQTVAYGDTATAPTTPTKNGYVFNKWVTTSGGSTAFNFSTAIKGDTTVYASWTPVTYTITFDADGGSNVGQMTYTIETATFALPTSKKDGHTFLNWADASGKTYTSIAKGSTGNLALTAKWKNSTVFTMEKVTFDYGEIINVTTYFDESGAWVGVCKEGETPASATPILKFAAPAAGTTTDITDKTKLDSYTARPEAWYPLSDDCSGELKSGTYIIYVKDAEGTVQEQASFTINTSLYSTVVTRPTCTEGGYTTLNYTDGSTSVTDEIDALGHEGAVEGDCTADYVCTTCGQFVEGAEAHTSSGAADCTTDEVCTVCGFVLDAAEGHDWQDATCTTPKTCGTCGATEGRELGHDWSLATCASPKECKNCHITEGEALGHAWIDADCFRAKTCYICNETEGEPLGHAWNEGIVIDHPTCTETGSIVYTCTRECNTQRTETLAANGHDYNVSVVEPTCSSKGYTIYDCKNCDYSYTDDFVAARHIPGDDATCTTPQSCLLCGAILSGVADHTPGPEATCDTVQKCTVCSTVLAGAKGHIPDGDGSCTEPVRCIDCGKEIAPPHGHTPGAAATCTSPQTCIDCDYVFTEALGHTPGAAATCDTAQHCTVCGEVVAPALGHTPGPAATCETGQYCLICCEMIASPLGHNVEKVSGKAATCTETGLSDGEVCTTCGKVFVAQTELPKTAHKAAKTKVTKATTSRNGEAVSLCACGVELSSKVIYKASTVKLSAKDLTYNGKMRSPSVIVKNSKGTALKKGVDYTVSEPSGRKLVGKYKYKITFKGNYSGTKSLYLTIKPTKPTILAPKSYKKALTVKWKKVSKQATGYQVMIATDKKFTKNKKTALIKKNSTVSKKFTKLKAKKTYYVKVRTYKTVKGVKYYSSWSKVKTIKTK